MKMTENHRRILKAATLYYQEEMTQAEIGRKLGVSRPVVSKMLQQAKEKGIVKIQIRDEAAYVIDLGIRLQKKFQLNEAIVIKKSPATSAAFAKKNVAKSAAAYLTEHLPDIQSIGLSWGTTLADIIDEMPYANYPQVKVVPMVGGVSSEHLYFDTNHLAFRLSEKLGGSCQYFYAPALAESKLFAKTLNQTELIIKAKKSALAVDFALIGVGNPDTFSTWCKLGYLAQEELKIIKKTAVVGDAVASLFDKFGRSVSNSISDRLLGVTVEELSQIPQVMIAASGVEKAGSIGSLLKAGTTNILVVDQAIAEKLLEE